MVLEEMGWSGANWIHSAQIGTSCTLL